MDINRQGDSKKGDGFEDKQFDDRQGDDQQGDDRQGDDQQRGDDESTEVDPLDQNSIFELEQLNMDQTERIYLLFKELKEVLKVNKLGQKLTFNQFYSFVMNQF